MLPATYLIHASIVNPVDVFTLIEPATVTRVVLGLVSRGVAGQVVELVGGQPPRLLAP